VGKGALFSESIFEICDHLLDWRWIENTHAVGPFVLAVEHGPDDSNANLLTQTPAEIDVCREISPESDGADFRSVSDCD